MAGISLKRRAPAWRGPYVAQALAELRSWPALAVSDTKKGVAVAVSGMEILRLTGRDAVRLRLTAPVIGRLGWPLRACGQVQAGPGDAWVTVQVEAEPDLDLLLALTSVAIQAHDRMRL